MKGDSNMATEASANPACAKSESDPECWFPLDTYIGGKLQASGTVLTYTLEDILALANLKLDQGNVGEPTDARPNVDRKPMFRTTGAAITMDLEYSNKNPGSGKPDIGIKHVRADATVTYGKGWAGLGALPTIHYQERIGHNYHEVVKYRQGVVLNFRGHGLYWCACQAHMAFGRHTRGFGCAARPCEPLRACAAATAVTAPVNCRMCATRWCAQALRVHGGDDCHHCGHRAPWVCDGCHRRPRRQPVQDQEGQARARRSHSFTLPTYLPWPAPLPSSPPLAMFHVAGKLELSATSRVLRAKRMEEVAPEFVMAAQAMYGAQDPATKMFGTEPGKQLFGGFSAGAEKIFGS